MDQKLKQWGFTYVGNCNCSGVHNRKYKRAEYLVYITATKFKVKKHGTTIKGYADISQAEAYIQKAIPNLPSGKQV